MKHWISLESEGELLRWFKAEPQEEGPRKPQGSIALAQVADIRDRTDLVPTNWPPTSEPGNSFIVGTPAKAYFFVAENEEQKRCVGVRCILCWVTKRCLLCVVDG